MRWILLVIVTTTAACSDHGTPIVTEGVRSFAVSFGEGTDLGSPDRPLPPADEYRFTIVVEARDRWGDRVSDFDGIAELSTLGAALLSAKRIAFENGLAGPVEVRIAYAYRTERIVVRAVSSEKEIFGAREMRLPTGPVGVSAPIYLPYPRIADVQKNHGGAADAGLSRLEKRNLTIRGKYDPATATYGDLVVIAAIEGGFYLADPDEPTYGSLYLYTYSTPYVDDAGERSPLRPGMLIREVNGSVFEFFGFTELSFPTFVPKRDEKGRILVDPTLVPAPRDITACVDADDDECLEGAESSLVMVREIVVADFDESDDGWLTYGQFPVETAQGGIILAQTSSTAPAFRPEKKKGQRLSSFTGLLKQHTSARPSTWILIPRDSADIVEEEKPSGR